MQLQGWHRHGNLCGRRGDCSSPWQLGKALGRRHSRSAAEDAFRGLIHVCFASSSLGVEDVSWNVSYIKGQETAVAVLLWTLQGHICPSDNIQCWGGMCTSLGQMVLGMTSHKVHSSLTYMSAYIG